MSEQNNTVPCVAVSVGADFESGTWTFEPVGDFVVGAGRYVIVPESVYVSDKQGVMLEALRAAKNLFDEALPKFNWGASALDANAIRLLNEAPMAVNAAIAQCEVSA